MATCIHVSIDLNRTNSMQPMSNYIYYRHEDFSNNVQTLTVTVVHAGVFERRRERWEWYSDFDSFHEKQISEKFSQEELYYEIAKNAVLLDATQL